jgi:hypothetical protein
LYLLGHQAGLFFLAFLFDLWDSIFVNFEEVGFAWAAGYFVLPASLDSIKFRIAD